MDGFTAVEQDSDQSLEEVRFYAGDTRGIFDRTTGETFQRGSKKPEEIAILGTGSENDSPENTPAQVELRTNGTISTTTVKANVKKADGETDIYSIEVGTGKTVKVPSGESSIEIQRSGGKTLIKGLSDSAIYGLDEKTNIAGFALKASGDTSIVVQDGQLSNITADSTNGIVEVRGGKTGNIAAKKASVEISEDGVAGNITKAKSVLVEGNASVGKITSTQGPVEIRNGGRAAGIDITKEATVCGGTVTGDVKRSCI